MTWLDISLMTIGNALICILLPRVLTFNWTEFWSKLNAPTPESQQSSNSSLS